MGITPPNFIGGIMFIKAQALIAYFLVDQLKAQELGSKRNRRLMQPAQFQQKVILGHTLQYM
jgi:hypothetical protein